ncbi:pentapeptide repeat-containing protein [Saccharopolyspora sp. NPDC050389]|uniref:pentapeptide repeat-containing protein n=1 Tax=Saccharopolyspora sp. NPDC050389 TaxID=3155516 RepID=UPI00340D20A1
MWRRQAWTAPNHRVLSNVTIWVWGIVLVVIAVGSVSGMLFFFGDDPKGSARLEAIRIASTVVVGTGGAAALLLAARRQRFAELDGTERRITELQTKAADQLGHEKAAVRLAGLHSLERLAQDHPSHRQAIVNIICAYLRMPFTPPGKRQSRRPIAGSLRRRREPAWARPNAATVDVVKDERQEEQEVRLTAQTLLAAHLAAPDRNKKGRPGNPKYWDHIGLELRGATLVDFDFGRCEVSSAIFDGARFVGDFADFRGANMAVASCQGATFEAPTVFEDCEISRASFARATFRKSVRFTRATLSAGADLPYIAFGKARFVGPAEFNGTRFADQASFAEAEFHGPLYFNDTDFEGGVRFDLLKARASAYFNDTRSAGDLSFERSSFESSSYFNGSLFEGEMISELADFGGPVYFNNSLFELGADFTAATFRESSYFNDSRFVLDARFETATFQGDAFFNKSEFAGAVSFDGARFDGQLHFADAGFLSDGAPLRGALFRSRPEKERLPAEHRGSVFRATRVGYFVIEED